MNNEPQSRDINGAPNQIKELQRAQMNIERVVDLGIGAPIFQVEPIIDDSSPFVEPKKHIIGTLIPYGQDKPKTHNVAMVFCNDGSLAEIFVDNNNNLFIDPKGEGIHLIDKPRQAQPYSSLVVSFLSSVNNGTCRILDDITMHPDDMLNKLNQLILIKKEEMSVSTEVHQTSLGKINEAFNKLFE